MKIIDSHCHVHKGKWNCSVSEDKKDYLVRRYGFTYVEGQILENMDEAGIEKTIIFPMPSQYIDLRRANNYVLKLAQEYPSKFIPFLTINKHPEAEHNNSAGGFKQHDVGQDIHPNDICRFKETYQFMREKHLPLIWHAGIPVVARVKEVIKYAPCLNIILAHCGAEFQKRNQYQPELNQVKNTLNQLKSYPNLYFDISAIKDSKIMGMAVAEVGDKKIIFGSDFPEEKPRETLERLSSLNLSESKLENILYNNINNLLSR